MTKYKLLIINLQNASKSQYISIKNVESFMWGRNLSNYMLVVTDGKNIRIPIDKPSADVKMLRKQSKML